MRALFPLVALSSFGCVTPAAELREILPDERLLIEGFDSDPLARGVGDPSDYYTLTRDVSRDVNAGIGEVLGLVESITSFEPTWTDEGTTALWGPWVDDEVEGQLWVTRDDDGAHRWAIELRPQGSGAADWTPVIAGEIEAGGGAAESAGWFVLDFTAIDALGAGEGETGELGVRYALRADGAEATVGFGEISEDGSIPTEGAYRYDHTRGAGGRMDLAFTEDVSEPPNGTSELAIVRSRWDGDGAGRADVYVTGGDLGPLTYTESDCWDTRHQTVFLENNFELLTSGDEADCVFAEPSFNEGSR